MTEKHYLLKVLGLSGIPKLVTFGLTLLSFPLLIRALGATEYGVVLIIGAALGIFEVLIDFGVSSGSGKAIASIRAQNQQTISREFFVWARMQAFFVIFGFAPMLLAARLMLHNNDILQRRPSVFLIMAAATGTAVILNFIRINLLSLLAFKSLAVLDTFESLLRSASFLIVAFFYPTAKGMAIAGLNTSIFTAILAIILISKRLPRGLDHNKENFVQHNPTSIKARLKDSLNFLWLRLSTRLFQQGSLLVIGRQLGPEVVGIIGAFSKISEIISTPYLVIGNALMVRINEISLKGQNALRKLWETAFRIMSTALIFSSLAYLAAIPLAFALLPASPQASKLFAILAFMTVATSTFALMAPMSDYLGGLSTRNILLTSVSLIQVPILMISAKLFDVEGAVLGYVIVFLTLATGYIFIASKVFFNKYIPIVSLEIIIFSKIVFFTLTTVILLKQLALFLGIIELDNTSFVNIQISLFLIFVTTLVWLNKKTRAFYYNSNFFEF